MDGAFISFKTDLSLYCASQVNALRERTRFYLAMHVIFGGGILGICLTIVGFMLNFTRFYPGMDTNQSRLQFVNTDLSIDTGSVSIKKSSTQIIRHHKVMAWS